MEDFLVKQFNSTGKKMSRRTEAIRIHTDVKVKEQGPTQPVRIGQKIKQMENLKSSQKKRMPQRLGQLSGRKTMHSREIVRPDRPVRRNLDFNVPSSSAQNNAVKTAEFALAESLPSNRTSFLLPLNDIRDKYVAQRNQDRSGFSRLPLVDKKIAGTDDKNARAPRYSTVSFKKPTSSTPCFKNLTKQAGKLKNSKGIPNHSSPCKLIESQDEGNEENRLPYEEPIAKDVDVLESDDANSQYAPSETICVRREEIVDLENNLKQYIASVEENLPKLKLTLTRITRLLSTDGNCKSTIQNNVDGAKSLANVEASAELPEAKRESDEVTRNTEIVVDSISYNSTTEKNNLELSPCKIIEEDTDDPNKIVTVSSFTEDKENYENINLTDEATTNSFLELENRLNITHDKCLSMKRLDEQSTSKPRGFNGRKYNKSLNEYMGLKSTMNILETPDANRFRSLCRVNDATRESLLDKTYISNKIFKDLCKLYSDSPDK